MLGAPIDGPVWMFDDNQSEINSTSNPAGRLKKRHLLLAFHRVKQLCASILSCFHVPSGSNLADVATKSTDHNTLWKLIRPILFWKGNIADCGTSEVEVNGMIYRVLSQDTSSISHLIDCGATGDFCGYDPRVPFVADYAPDCGEYQTCNGVQSVADGTWLLVHKNLRVMHTTPPPNGPFPSVGQESIGPFLPDLSGSIPNGHYQGEERPQFNGLSQAFRPS